MSKLAPPCRVTFAVLSFFGMVTVYMLRINLSVALVSMVNGTDTDHSNSSEQVCPPQPHRGNSSDQSPRGEFDWDEQTQGLILGAFFWGYIITQIPGGIASEIYGPKWIFGVGILWTSVLTLLTPLAARWSLPAFICLRVMEGIGEGVTFPAMYSMLGRWAPPMEKTFMTIFIVSGSYVGTVIGLPLSGWLCDSDLMGGWPSVFYIFGACGCVWFLLWSALVHNSPAQHPYITDAERQYIVNSLSEQGVGPVASVSLRSLPFGQMLKSGPVLSLIVTHMSFNWTFYMMLTCLPTFLSRILSMPIREDSVLSALPYLSLTLVANMMSLLADIARKRQWLTTTQLRKGNTAIGQLISATGLIVLGNIGCDIYLATACLVVFVGFSGIAVAGFSANYLDLAPKYAGTLLGIGNSMGTIPGMLAPVVVGAFTNHASTHANWLKVFYLSAGINVLGAVTFLVFGTGELQAWAIGEQQPLIQTESDGTNSNNYEAITNYDHGVQA